MVLSDEFIGVLNEDFKVRNGVGEVVNGVDVSFIIGSVLVSQFL